MKKVLFQLLALLCILSCSEDLTDYYTRLDERSAANEALKKKNDDLSSANDALAKRNADIAAMNARLKLEGQELFEKLLSLEASTRMSTPKLLSFEFVTADNSSLSQNVVGEIVGDSIIDCWIPKMMSDKFLIPRYKFAGTLVTIDGMEAESGVTMFDFGKPVILTVHTSVKSVSYKLYVHAYTGLPIMWIYTVGGAPIVSRDEYINGNMILTEDSKTRGPGDVLRADLQIKGRGNYNWNQSPKKSYRLKFTEKVSLFGEHKDKSWVLIPNYADKSALRNHIALYLGKMSNLEYTSSSHFVELILNGQYNGMYQVCEKMKISNHRVAVGDDGFLLEVTMRAAQKGLIYFYVNHMTNPISIEDPDVTEGDDNYNYAKAHVANADAVLYSDYFKDPTRGWRAYFDMDSFVEWYLVNEIAHNTDAAMLHSCFMHFKRGGKIAMGPIWDFDLGFGNTDYFDRGPYDFWIKKSDWISRMFNDPVFVAKVKERYDYFYSRKADIMRVIDETAVYLKWSAYENENRWHTFYQYVWPNYEFWGSYYNEVQSVKEWLNSRMDWLKVEFDKM